MTVQTSTRDDTKTSTNEGTDPGKDGAGGLTAIGMLVAPLIAAMGGLALTGTIGRVQRDEPTGFCIALALVIASGVLWVAAPNAPDWKIRKKLPLSTATKGIAFVLGGIGFVAALALAVNTANNAPRPQITPTLVLSDGGGKLTTEIEASNLATDRRLAFRVDLLRRMEVVGHVYESYIGPDGDGNIDETVTVALPKSNYTEVGVKAYTGTTSPNCDDFSLVRDNDQFLTGTGCVIITLPEAAVRQR